MFQCVKWPDMDHSSILAGPFINVASKIHFTFLESCPHDLSCTQPAFVKYHGNARILTIGKKRITVWFAKIVIVLLSHHRICKNMPVQNRGDQTTYFPNLLIFTCSTKYYFTLVSPIFHYGVG